MYALIVLYALISFNQVLNTQTQTECIDDGWCETKREREYENDACAVRKRGDYD